MMLTSLNNPRIKELIKLRKADFRKETQSILIEGRQELRLALGSNITIKELYFCPQFFGKGNDNLLLEAQGKGVSLCEVNEKAYHKIAYGSRREGLIAVARQPELPLAAVKLKAHPLLVVVEHIEKPGNLGAIIRSADAAGADAVIVADALCDIYNPNVVRSSLGAIFSIVVIKAETQGLILWLKAHRIKAICACVEAELSYTSVDFTASSAIILGSEEKGLSGLWKKEADCRVSIPMTGKVDSLNVSVAASVLLFEAVRQRKA